MYIFKPFETPFILVYAYEIYVFYKNKVYYKASEVRK